MNRLDGIFCRVKASISRSIKSALIGGMALRAFFAIGFDLFIWGPKLESDQPSRESISRSMVSMTIVMETAIPEPLPFPSGPASNRDRRPGRYNHPSTFATGYRVAMPGTRLYVPRLRKYYVMEDTCTECTKDRDNGRIRVDLYIGGNSGIGGGSAWRCENTLTADPFTMSLSSILAEDGQ